MYAARLSRFGPPDLFVVGEGPDLPAAGADEVVVRVRATSVNPIDCMRRTGYGRKLLGLVGAAGLPLILGQDLAGEVEQAPADGSLKEGDRVWAGLPPTSHGSYAERTLVSGKWLRPMPKKLSFEQAALLPYAALTGYAALSNLRLNQGNAAGKRVLIQGGSGGVGSFCVQLLSAWGAEVTTLSSAANLEFCRQLGAADTLDYNALPDTQAGRSEALSGYHGVLAAFGMEEMPCFSPRLLAAGGSYTTLRHPLLEWSDRHGILPGIAAAAAVMVKRRLDWARRARRYSWTLFRASGRAMERLGEAVTEGQVRPISEQSFQLDKIGRAHELIETGRVRGKVGIRIGEIA